MVVLLRWEMPGVKVKMVLLELAENRLVVVVRVDVDSTTGEEALGLLDPNTHSPLAVAPSKQ